MTYQLSWHIPDQVLALDISGEYTLNEAEAVNTIVGRELKQVKRPITIIIDATYMERPRNFQELRAAQNYMHHRYLDHIMVASDDKVIKLAMMIIFNMSRAYFTVVDSVDQALTQIQ